MAAAIFAVAYAQAEDVDGKTLFNVRDYGATGDGVTLDSPAINQAICAASQSGGGTVWVPAGRYLSGSIRLTNNINLHLDAGAVILGAPQNMNAYDETEPFQGHAYEDGGHVYFHNSLMWGENLTNVSITGQGMISGGGLVAWDDLTDRMSGFNIWNKPNATWTNLPPVRLGNKAIALKLCRNILIRDVTIYHGGHFAILVTGCDNLTVDNVTMDTDRDGIDIDCCRNTMVFNCRINSPNDDGLCPKSTYALGRRVITENLAIVNCQVSGFEEGTLLDGTMKPHQGGMGRIKFGTESSGGFRNVTIANCTFRSCRGLALEEVDGGILENISVNNLTMMDINHYPIYITLGRRDRTPGATNGVLRNISISNVIASGVGKESGIQITGMPGDNIEGVRLQNIRMNFNGGGTVEQAATNMPELGTGYPEPFESPAFGLFARHVKDLELQNVRFSFAEEDHRPAMICNDVDGLEIDDFKSQVAEKVPLAKFDLVKDLVIRNSPSLETTIGFSNVETSQAATVTSLFDGKTLNGWIDQENSANQFDGGDIKDVSGFAKKLVAKSGPVSAFLSDKLGEKNSALLADYLASPSNSVVAPAEAVSTNSTAKKTKTLPSKASVVRSMLARNLTKIISDDPVYDETRFSGVQLRPETNELLGKNPQGYDLERLNKLLIEDAYPAEIAPGAIGWIVKDGAIVSTGAGRGTLYTAQDYSHYRLLLTMRHVSGRPDHPAAVLFFCTRPKDGEAPLDALGAIQFMIPQGYHWDYRPGHNGWGGVEFTTVAKSKFNDHEWSRVEILVDAAKGTARLAVAQPPGAKAVELLDYKLPEAGKTGPIALQMHNGGLFDEYKDITVEVNPKVDDLITVK